jgi:NAD(P)-dependent dehydrogenase (short-subunit alcohol dehydrogenase family)
MKIKKYALITGATRGLGEYILNALWLSGWSIFAVARTHQDLLNLVGKLPSRDGQDIFAFPCDIGNEHQINSLVNEVKNKLFYLDLLINNAAIHGPIGPFLENDFDLWREAFEVNFFGPANLCRQLAHIMGKKSRSSIINISGGGAAGLRPNFSAYASSKVALVRFSETLADELRTNNINVNCISPGPMATKLLRELTVLDRKNIPQKEIDMANSIIGKQSHSMDDIVSLILFLTSQEGSKITGKLISAIWDNWQNWPNHLDELISSDLYTLRRITSRDRGFDWGDK